MRAYATGAKQAAAIEPDGELVHDKAGTACIGVANRAQFILVLLDCEACLVQHNWAGVAIIARSFALTAGSTFNLTRLKLFNLAILALHLTISILAAFCATAPAFTTTCCFLSALVECLCPVPIWIKFRNSSQVAFVKEPLVRISANCCSC